MKIGQKISVSDCSYYWVGGDDEGVDTRFEMLPSLLKQGVVAFSFTPATTSNNLNYFGKKVDTTLLPLGSGTAAVC